MSLSARVRGAAMRSNEAVGPDHDHVDTKESAISHVVKLLQENAAQADDRSERIVNIPGQERNTENFDDQQIFPEMGFVTQELSNQQVYDRVIDGGIDRQDSNEVERG